MGQAIFSKQEGIIPNGTAESEAFDIRGMRKAHIHMGAVWTAASIGFKISPTLDGPFFILRDAAAAIIEITGPAAFFSYVIPDGVMSAAYVKLWSQTAGFDVNQVADAPLWLGGKT